MTWNIRTLSMKCRGESQASSMNISHSHLPTRSSSHIIPSRMYVRVAQACLHQLPVQHEWFGSHLMNSSSPTLSSYWSMNLHNACTNGWPAGFLTPAHIQVSGWVSWAKPTPHMWEGSKWLNMLVMKLISSCFLLHTQYTLMCKYTNKHIYKHFHKWGTQTHAHISFPPARGFPNHAHQPSAVARQPTGTNHLQIDSFGLEHYRGTTHPDLSHWNLHHSPSSYHGANQTRGHSTYDKHTYLYMYMYGGQPGSS